MQDKTGHCHFQDYQVKSGLLRKRKLGAFLNQLIYHYRKKKNSMSYTFVNDDHLLNMNKQYLNHDTYTDIITFDLSEKKSPLILADIYISIDRVRDNAQSLGLKYQEELLRVIIHGALHICGFKDKSNKEKEIMRKLENEHIQEFMAMK